MTFTFTNYAGIQPQHSPLHDMIGQILGGYEGATKAQFLRPSLEEQLKKAQLENKYYGPNIESQMGLRSAQAGHLGSLTTGQNITNRYLEPKLQAEIDSLNASAQKARLLQMIREGIMGGGQQTVPGQINQQAANIPMFQGQGMPNPIQQHMQSQLSPQQQSSGQPFAQQQAPQQLQQPEASLPFGGDYAKAAIANQMLGLGAPKIVDINGKQMAITPFGVFDTGAHGLSEEEKAFQSGLGKYEAKLYGDSIDTYNTLERQGVALDELTNAVENDPQFRNVTGPIGSFLTTWAGSGEQRELLGKLASSSGEIALQVAPSLKGAFTGRDQTLINTIKASPKDFPDVFIGKLKAQKLINNVLSNRAKLTAENIEKRMKPLEAARKAALATPLDKYRQTVKDLTTHRNVLPPEELLRADEILKRRKAEAK